MLNALEELRKIREAQVTQGHAEAVSENLPTNPTKASSAVSVLPPSAGVSAVLNLLSASSCPLPHPQIVKSLTEKGQSKDAAKQAINYCQAQGWIEHNLTTGYVLTSKPQTVESDCNSLMVLSCCSV